MPTQKTIQVVYGRKDGKPQQVFPRGDKFTLGNYEYRTCDIRKADGIHYGHTIRADCIKTVTVGGAA